MRVRHIADYGKSLRDAGSLCLTDHTSHRFFGDLAVTLRFLEVTIKNIRSRRVDPET